DSWPPKGFLWWYRAGYSSLLVNRITDGYTSQYRKLTWWQRIVPTRFLMLTRMIQSLATGCWQMRPKPPASRWLIAPPGGSATTTNGSAYSADGEHAATVCGLVLPSTTIWCNEISQQPGRTRCG